MENAVNSSTLADVLATRARLNPGQTFLRTGTESINYAAADAAVQAYAAGFQARGVAQGDRVVLLMANSIEQVLVWLALNRIGAVNVPLNTSLTSALIARSVELVRPAALVADRDLAPVLLDSAVTQTLRTDLPFFVYEPDPAPTSSNPPPGTEPLSALRASTPVLVPPVDRLDAATMLFTSGSTGVPKACVLSHHYLIRAGEIHAKYLGFKSDDVLFTPFPLFHIDAATLTVGAALAVGATAALSSRFSASKFWDEVRACQATVFNFMGATANILWKQPPSPRDRDHRVRLAWGVPMPACEPEWGQRFGFPLVEVYGLTDAGVPAYQPLDVPRREGSCGRIIPEYEVRIGNESGDSVAPGAVGEILIRSDEAGLLMNEYYNMPETTATAFRDGWFHTGDLGRLDEENHLYFVTRGKEVIRRRGENIAAADVEEAVDAHPAVRESAAVGVPSELSEDDIRIFVVLQPDADLQPAELLEHCRHTLPRHMIPRYLEFVPDLPKTPTEKVERFKLADRPLTPNTWDSERSSTDSLTPSTR